MTVVRILAKVAFGVFIGGVLGVFFTGGDPNYTIVWAIAIPASILLSLTNGLRGTLRRGSDSFALARVETVQRAASYDGGRQGIDLRLVVAPKKGSAYTTTTTLVVLADDLRNYNSGTVFVVARANDNRPDVTIVPDPTPEWAALAEKARHDSSLIPVASAAPAWEPATTTTAGTPRPGSGIASGTGGFVVSLVIIAATAAIVLIPAYGAIGRAFSDLARGDFDGGNMVSGVHQQEAVDAIASVAGSHQFTTINFYDSYVLADALTSPGANTTDAFQWRYGRASREGPSFIQSTELDEELFDASGLDFSIIGSLVEEARAAAKLDNVDSTFVSVRRSSIEISTEPIIYIAIDNAYYGASFQYAFDGTLIEQSGSAFER